MDAPAAAAAVVVGPREPKIAWLPVQALSPALAYGSLMLTGALLALFLAYRAAAHGLLPRAYGAAYTNLGREHRQSFLGHHVGGAGLGLVLALACYPALCILAVPGATLRTPLWPGAAVELGDAALFLTEVYGALYLAELYARYAALTWLLVAHHVGLLVISQTAIVLSAALEAHPEATIEIYMCIVWATFDMVTEIPLHVCLILWRLWRTRYRFLARMCALCAAWIVAMALFETAVTIYLLHTTWDRWEGWRVATPVVFSLWICTQLYGGWNFVQMSMGCRRKARDAAPDDPESATAATVVVAAVAAAAAPDARRRDPPRGARKGPDRADVVEVAPGAGSVFASLGGSVSSFRKTHAQSRTNLVVDPLSSSSSHTRNSASMDHDQH